MSHFEVLCRSRVGKDLLFLVASSHFVILTPFSYICEEHQLFLCYANALLFRFELCLLKKVLYNKKGKIYLYKWLLLVNPHLGNNISGIKFSKLILHCVLNLVTSYWESVSWLPWNEYIIKSNKYVFRGSSLFCGLICLTFIIQIVFLFEGEKIQSPFTHVRFSKYLPADLWSFLTFYFFLVGEKWGICNNWPLFVNSASWLT